MTCEHCGRAHPPAQMVRLHLPNDPQGAHGGTESVIWLCSPECCRDWILDWNSDRGGGRVLHLAPRSPNPAPPFRCGACGAPLVNHVPLCDGCAAARLPPRDGAPA